MASSEVKFEKINKVAMNKINDDLNGTFKSFIEKKTIPHQKKFLLVEIIHYPHMLYKIY